MDDAKKDIKKKKRIFIIAVVIALYLAGTKFSFWPSVPLIIILVVLIGYLNLDVLNKKNNDKSDRDKEYSNDLDDDDDDNDFDDDDDDNDFDDDDNDSDDDDDDD